MENSLASQLELVQTMVGELGHHDLPQAAREIVGKLASGVDRSLRMAKSCWPGSGETAVAAVAPKDPHFRKSRKGMPVIRKQVSVLSEEDMTPLEDGFSWRKYGQKDILGAKHPRSYFKCTFKGTRRCEATKKVQRSDADPLVFDVVYEGEHTCIQAAAEQQQQQEPGYRSATEELIAVQGPDIGGLQIQADGDHAAHSSAEDQVWENIRMAIRSPPIVYDADSYLFPDVVYHGANTGIKSGHADQVQSSPWAPETGGLQAGPFSSTNFDSFYPPLSPMSSEWPFPSSHHAGMEFEHHYQPQEEFPDPFDITNFLWDHQNL